MLINITIGCISKTIKVDDIPELWEQVEIGNDIYEAKITVSVHRRGDEVINWKIVSIH